MSDRLMAFDRELSPQRGKKINRKMKFAIKYIWRFLLLTITILICAKGYFLYVYTYNYHINEATRKDSKTTEKFTLPRYRHAAIATDSQVCSDIAREILQNKGGSSVDAAIAVMVCYGVVNPMSSGLGGGFFMNIYDRAFFSLSMEYSVKGRAYGIDARETAPAKATKDMFSNRREISQLGGLSIGVPGEVKGYEEAHKLYGKLPWKDLFQPSIDLARKGFRISENLASCLKLMEKVVVRDPDMRTAFTNPKTGTLLKTGDRAVLPKLADTMERIATEGADSFYSGRISYDVTKDLREKGSIISRDDLRRYQVKHVTPLKISLQDDSQVYSLPPPSSGSVLLFILGILDGFKMAPMILKRKTEKLLAYHRIVEAFKFAYAKRTYLGDQRFNENNNITSLLTSREYANFIRLRISDRTYHPSYYGPSYYGRSSGGTAHLSIVGHDNLAVSATTTINLKFGSGVMGSRTGLIFNDVMDDFSSPKFVNAFGLPPSPANFISPGKRPLSSMCPVIIVDKKGSVTMVTGASGGSRITSSTAYVISRVLWFGDNIKDAIMSPRMHHQLYPPLLFHEGHLTESFEMHMTTRGHHLRTVTPFKSVVNGITRHGDYLEAYSDDRRPGGGTAGF